MIPQYNFDNSYDKLSTDIDRKVLNTGPMNEKTGFVIRTEEDKRADARSGRYSSVEFTDESVSYVEPFEDEELLSGKVTPTVAGYYDTGYDGRPKVYDPSSDNLEALSLNRSRDIDPIRKDIGKIPKEAYGTPELFKDPLSLVIGCVIASLLIIVEIIALIVIL
ncbi:MAG: hypothetical protein II718_05670 [Clostridiales bacterium]|nr:hypothetical protein [Clostridiales bacterium]